MTQPRRPCTSVWDVRAGTSVAVKLCVCVAYMCEQLTDVTAPPGLVQAEANQPSGTGMSSAITSMTRPYFLYVCVGTSRFPSPLSSPVPWGGAGRPILQPVSAPMACERVSCVRRESPRSDVPWQGAASMTMISACQQHGSACRATYTYTPACVCVLWRLKAYSVSHGRNHGLICLGRWHLA